MANSYWTSSSLNSFMNASLNLGNSPYSGIYSNLADASLIKSGSYKKLMKSYVSEMKKAEASDSKTDSDKKTDKNKSDSKTNSTTASAYDKTGKKTGATIKNTVLDDILSHKPYESKNKNSYLDKMLAENAEKAKKAEDAKVTTKSEEVATPAAGSVIDEQA